MKDAVDWDAPADPASGLFGFDIAPDEAEVVIVGVPWEPTISYGRGTAGAPGRIVRASHQLDLYDDFRARSVGPEVAMAPLREDWGALNAAACAAAARGDKVCVNASSDRLNDELHSEAAAHLAAGRVVGTLGGDHSAPFGAIRATAVARGPIAILHIDAHHDLRAAYGGYEHSHASIIHNVLERIPGVALVISVGVRDYSVAERERAAKDERVFTFYDRDLKRDAFRGRTWDDACAEIVASLSENVYVSFDVDGLDPRFCPHTGTPVPGGLDYDEALHLLESVVATGRRVVGFDLCEVSPDPDGDEWDLNVGSRLLHALCSLSVPA